MRPCFLLAAFGSLLGGCAGKPVTEMAEVASNPLGVACTVEGCTTQLGTVASTPGRVEFVPDPGVLRAACSKPGFVTASVERAPSYSHHGLPPPGMAFLFVAAFALPAPRSDGRYPATITLDLAREGEARPLPLSGLRLQ